jgi:hypothetical protein
LLTVDPVRQIGREKWVHNTNTFTKRFWDWTLIEDYFY